MPKTLPPQANGAIFPETPWFVHVNAEQCEIVATNTGEVLVLGTVNANDAQRTEELANHLVDAVNAEQRYIGLIKEMAYALELCLENDTLSWEAEQEARVLYNRVMNSFD